MKSFVSTLRIGDRVVIGSSIAHDTDTLHWQQDRERLAGVAIKARRFDLVDHDRVCLAEYGESLPSHFAQAAYRQSGAGERVSPHQRFGQAEFEAQTPHFVFEQITQRFNQFKAQFFGQTADVVVQLDRGRRPVPGRRRFRSRRGTAFPGRENARLGSSQLPL